MPRSARAPCEYGRGGSSKAMASPFWVDAVQTCRAPSAGSRLPPVTSRQSGQSHVGSMTALSRVAQIVRQHDPARFLPGLFAPPDKRETLWALYAFNHELARAQETVREPMMA